MTDSRRKGAAAELAVVAWLRRRGYEHVERAPGGRNQPRHGDLLGLPGLSIEVKNHRQLDLAGWLDQARQQADGLPFLVIHKRRGVLDPGAWYCTSTLDQWERLARVAGLLDPVLGATRPEPNQ